MEEMTLQEELQLKSRKKLAKLFARYKMNFDDLEAAIRWKPIFLFIGNYSSGKSTLINEIIGQNIQRTGQSPTDDAFTVLTSEKSNGKTGEIPGSTLVNDKGMPFGKFKKFGERLTSHLCLKYVDTPFLEKVAIIDSPGMLDAVTEKDRGYNYMEVLGEFAKIADIIVLMFDPHKAGTIKETYTAIRNTLPETSNEDRALFVMSRIDECDNQRDLIRSYGTLCWNMSQMTGRKDIPHIFLTYSPEVANMSDPAVSWPQERYKLIEKLKSAPDYRMNHILEDVDRQVNELKIVAEAMAEYARKGRRLIFNTFKLTAIISIMLFLFGDTILKSAISWPNETLIELFRNDALTLTSFIVPGAFALMIIVIAVIWFTKFGFQRFTRKTKKRSNELLILDTEYRQQLWYKMEDTFLVLLDHATRKELFAFHGRNVKKAQKFINKELGPYYYKINRKLSRKQTKKITPTDGEYIEMTEDDVVINSDVINDEHDLEEEST